MGPASTSPRALHGWALEASSCSFRSCRVGTSVVRVLSWAKPCSASWDLRVVCTFFLKKKYSHLGVAPEPLAIWNKELEGLVLKLFWFFVERLPSIFLSWGLEVVCLEEVFLVTCAFSKKKVHSLSVAPEPLAIWNKELEGLESYVVWKLLSWKSLSSDVRFFEKKCTHWV